MGIAVSIEQVVKDFPGLRALDGVSLEIAEGEFFGLLGPNGAGKTTLISCLAGLVRPTAGRLSILGHDVIGDYRQARRQLGVVPQELVFDPFFSVRETLRFQSGYYGIRNNDDWIDEILDALDLTAKAETNMRRLSGGMKRRVLVAQALVHRPPVIVLDEPTAGVDVELRQSLWQFIRRLNQDGHTVILTTHYLEEAEALCGRIAMLKQGRLVALDSTHNLLARYSGHTLTLRLGGKAGLPAPFAGKATGAEGRWTIRLGNLAEVEAVLAGVRAAGGVIEDMQLAQTDLEDVFVSVMQDGKSDVAGVMR
ncbi:ABC transporter ATP-binding protein [Propionivibrio dicarboxylicus]|uniref:ABC-2 type transport system ATP-binding protein n=1 Tax=Propionivibrio dicarboxylicus TaxID=83767 RepID=A0A1G8FS62_9RHOO|nr:ABC transporter ATP-binding protein [Propionivibrio dicarboxylicus]SDH84969.1 ABC-2 type transport system ATP-binding protein [Propionivibrio dicarboxylicus]